MVVPELKEITIHLTAIIEYILNINLLVKYNPKRRYVYFSSPNEKPFS